MLNLAALLERASEDLNQQLITNEMMKKILVIEDQDQTRSFFLECLETEGFHAIGAENGLLGVQLAQEQLPDVVICDLVMPLLDGYGVLTALRQNPTTAIIPFIFITARGTRADVRKGMELGADDYLAKPTTVEEFLGAIAAQLAKQAALQQFTVAQFQSVVPAPASVDTATSDIPQSIFPANSKWSEVFRFIEANYHRPITVHEVAQALGYSQTYLTTLVGNQTGKTINRWIIEYRMAKARCLLQQTNLSAEQVAAEVGYQTVCHFFRQFRQYHRTTPQAWKKSHQAQVSSR